jgi:hypothetical protein
MTATDEHTAGDEPPADEIAQMRAATASEAQVVDCLVLRECDLRWQKVARVVGSVSREFDAALPHLPFAYIQARMQALEDAGLVEITGDVWSMLHSEIRKLESPNAA